MCWLVTSARQGGAVSCVAFADHRGDCRTNSREIRLATVSGSASFLLHFADILGLMQLEFLSLSMKMTTPTYLHEKPCHYNTTAAPSAPRVIAA